MSVNELLDLLLTRRIEVRASEYGEEEEAAATQPEQPEQPSPMLLDEEEDEVFIGVINSVTQKPDGGACIMSVTYPDASTEQFSLEDLQPRLVPLSKTGKVVLLKTRKSVLVAEAAERQLPGRSAMTVPKLVAMLEAGALTC